MSKGMERFWYVLLALVSNVGMKEQPVVQFASATQRSLEEVLG
jgi:hypothetical protein